MTSNGSRTLFVGNLSERVTEELLYELFLQAGPLETVRIPVQNGRRRAFGFVEFKHEVSLPYAARLFYQTSLYGRMLKLQYHRPQGRFSMNEEMMHMPPMPNHLMSRLGPPIEDKHRLPPTLPHPPPPSFPPPRNHYLQHKRMPSHLMPSPAKKRNNDDVSGKHIPDSLDFKGLIGNDVAGKKKNEKDTEDLRSKLKKKKRKKKSKEFTPNKSPKTSKDEDVKRGGFNEFDYPAKSYFRNAVNQIKQHCSRNNRGSYDFNSRHKYPKHKRFDT